MSVWACTDYLRKNPEYSDMAESLNPQLVTNLYLSLLFFLYSYLSFSLSLLFQVMFEFNERHIIIVCTILTIIFRYINLSVVVVYK